LLAHFSASQQTKTVFCIPVAKVLSKARVYSYFSYSGDIVHRQ